MGTQAQGEREGEGSGREGRRVEGRGGEGEGREEIRRH